MSLLAARLRHRLRRLGAPALAGLTLMAFALALHLTGTRAATAQLEDVQAQIERLRASAAPAAADADPIARQLRAMDEFLPGRAELPAALETLHRAAADRGLALRTVEYKAARERDTDLALVQITLPVAGSYAQVRAWLGEVMDALPSAALDEFSLKRDAPGNPAVEGRVRFSLYFREP